MEVELAPNERIAKYERECSIVFRVMGVEPVYYSDESSIDDFIDAVDAEDIGDVMLLLNRYFGCAWDIAEPLVDILDRRANPSNRRC